jgi:hypothetical protein
LDRLVPTKTPQHGTLKSGTQKDDLARVVWWSVILCILEACRRALHIRSEAFADDEWVRLRWGEAEIETPEKAATELFHTKMKV